MVSGVASWKEQAIQPQPTTHLLQEFQMQATTIAVDLGKNVFEIAMADESGK